MYAHCRSTHVGAGVHGVRLTRSSTQAHAAQSHGERGRTAAPGVLRGIRPALPPLEATRAQVLTKLTLGGWRGCSLLSSLLIEIDKVDLILVLKVFAGRVRTNCGAWRSAWCPACGTSTRSDACTGTYRNSPSQLRVARLLPSFLSTY